MAPSLQKIAEYLKTLDPTNDMEGHAYRLDTNNQLGINKTSDPLDFYVFIPYGSWDTYPKVPEQNVLAAAITEALSLGLSSGNYWKSPEGEKYVFVDMSNFLGYDVKFFHDDGPKGVFETLNRGINALPEDVTPIIRVLAGGPGIKRSDFSADEAGTLFQRVGNFLSKMAGFSTAPTGTVWTAFTELLWATKKPVADPNGTLWSRYADLFWKDGFKWHPKAQLYIGWYNPDHELDLGALVTELPGLPEKILQFVEGKFNDKFKGDHPQDHIDTMTSFVREAVDKLSHALKVPGLPALSWNHGKIIAVNGLTLTTGGANQYDNYGDGTSDLFDSQFKVKGDVALHAHRFVDTMWRYLNTLPTRNDDDSSMLFTRSLASSRPKSAKDFHVSPAPLFNDMAQHVPNVGTQSILSVCNLGDTLPDGIRYPVQSLNIVRDTILNLAWLEFLKLPQMEDFIYFGFTFLVDLLSDHNIQHILQEYKISPVAWASKITRFHALENAEDNIILYQQELVNEDLQYEKAQCAAVVGDLKKYLGLDWDGSIIPFELLLALARGLKRIHDHHPFDSSHGVQILMSAVDDTGEYGGPYKCSAITAILEKLLFACGVPDSGQVVRHRVEFRRIMANDKNHHVHSKVVCVDKSLLYAGSDNAYPQYNEQHGIWIEDKKNINAWHDQFWIKLWNQSTKALD